MANAATTLIVPDERIARLRQQWSWEDRFLYYATAREWTLTATDSGTAVLQAAAAGAIGGQLKFAPAGATANDEMYFFRTVSQFLFEDGRTFSIRMLLNWAQAATNNAAVHFGFMSAPAANTIIDTTGVPKASFSGALIYSIAGSLYWQAGCSIGTSLQTKASNKVAGGTASQELRIDVKCANGIAEIEYFVDGEPLIDDTTAWTNSIKHNLTYSGAAAMTPYLGIKQCSAVAQPVTAQAYGEQAGYGTW